METRRTILQRGHHEIERFLLEPGRAMPQGAWLHALGMGPYAYSRIGPRPMEQHVDGPRVRLATARHIATRNALMPLLGAWQEAGIATIVFKGFLRAELDYPWPSQRPYNDVDLIIEPEKADEAAAIACKLGWRLTWRAGQLLDIEGFADTGAVGHELMHLQRHDLHVRLDVHRRLVAEDHRFRGACRITRAAWRYAVPVRHGDIEYLRLHPLDSVLIGLVINRCWSFDDWDLKPFDYPDFQALIERHGITKQALTSRARELGCARTFDLFLERCDPFAGRLSLAPVPAATKARWRMRVAAEREFPALQRLAYRIAAVPGTLVDMIREWPSIQRAHRQLRTESPMSARATTMGPARWQAFDPQDARWLRILRGIRWALVAIRQSQRTHPLLLNVALQESLRRRGYEPTLQIERDPGDGRLLRIQLELDGVVLSSYWRGKAGPSTAAPDSVLPRDSRRA